MWRYTYTYVCLACACTCTTQVLPHISILCFAHPHFPIGARCTRESQHALPRLKNKLGYLRAHADLCHFLSYAYMTWCTCACTYVLHAHVCAQIQHFLTFQNFASHVHVFRSGTLQLPAGVTACVAMLPRLKNKRVRMQMSRTMSMQYARMRTSTSSHFSILLRMSTFRCARCTGVAACVVIASPQNKFRVQTCHVVVVVGVAPFAIP